MLALIFLAIGGFVFSISIDLIKSTLDIKNWPKTTAVIVDKKYDKIEGVFDYFIPYVYYQYQVEGRHYTSDRIFLDQGDSFSEEKIQQLLERYPVGRELDANYNPANPGIAMLEVGIKPFYVIISVFGLLFMITGLFILRKLGRNAAT